jgi:hypothetical protein
MAKKGPGRVRGRAAYQVFVSHATADKWLARTLCEKIEAIGAATFRDDRDIKGGDLIPDEIFDALEASREFLVLMTPASVSRPWVLFEVGAARRCRGLRIVPVTYHVGMDLIPAMIHQNRGFALNDVDQYLAELGERVRIA